MKLFIDTTDSEKIKIRLGEKTVVQQARHNKSQVLLATIARLAGGKPDKISKIDVVTGPGSFTGLRVGIAVANALGFSLNVPVNGRDVVRQGGVLPVYE